MLWKMLTVGGINVEQELNGEERCSTLAHQCQYQYYFVCKWSNTHCPVEKAAGCIFRKPWIGNLIKTIVVYFTVINGGGIRQLRIRWSQ